MILVKNKSKTLKKKYTPFRSRLLINRLVNILPIIRALQCIVLALITSLVTQFLTFQVSLVINMQF